MIDQNQYKKDVLKLLRKLGEPVWVSDLSRKHGLAYALSCRENPSWVSLKELEEAGLICFLRSRYYRKDTNKPRWKIALPSHKDTHTTFEYRLLQRIKELEEELRIIKGEKGDKNGILKRMFSK